MNRMIVEYTPDYDGQLWVYYEEHGKDSFRFSITHSKAGSAWETLVKAAQAIIDQEARRAKDPKKR